MSVRTSIAIALAEKLKLINGESPYLTNINNNAYPKLKFWDEVNDYPCIYMSTGSESREYHPAGFKWGFLGISLKLYVKGENHALDLENLLEDVERIIDANRSLMYNTTTSAQTTEILINSIVTDEGLLEPYGVGEVNITVQYPVL